MESSTDKEWASRHLLDPLTSAEPADETGPGTHFGNTMASTGDKRSSTQIKSDKQKPSTRDSTAGSSYPSPPPSASPYQTAFPEYREEAFGGSKGVTSPRQSSEIPTSPIQSKTDTSNDGMPRRRGSSLGARFAGDKSHRPLDMLREQNDRANRHHRKTNKVGADTIDKLDKISTGSPYHHDGPYDATLMGRNLDPRFSPVEAVGGTNMEALRATPREFIKDSVEGHRPLAGTATIPPGEPDRYGRVLKYREGPNLNVEMGWRRWEGITYHPDDIKGKGEPSYTIEKALKEHKAVHQRVTSEGDIEMTTRPRASSTQYSPATSSSLRNATGIDSQELSQFQEQPYSEWANAGGVRRAHTTGRRSSGMANTLKNKFGSLRRRKPSESRSAGQGSAARGGAFGAKNEDEDEDQL